MALANYGDLKSAVASYLNRSDLTSYIPDFIRLAERRISYGSDQPFPSLPVRVPAMQATATGTTSGSIAYPTGFLEVIRLACSDGNYSWDLEYATNATYTSYANKSDRPAVYSFLGNAIKTAGTGSASYTLDHYAALTALSADGDTNWLITNAPDVYLFGALLESAPFIQDLQMVQGWHGMYRSIVGSLNRNSMKPSGGSMRVRAN